MKTITSLPALLEAFFTDRLMRQRKVSSHTIAAYRDTFRLLLCYAKDCLKKSPSELALEDLDATFIGAFLYYLEEKRNNSARSRNLRLAAIHSFFRYVAFEQPAHSALIQRVLAIPCKRCDRGLVDFLTPPEVDALLAAPDCSTWGGRRDRAIITFAVQTGLRVSELISLCCQDISLGTGSHVLCEGKGRKKRCTPLTKHTVVIMRAWLRERSGQPSDPLFPNARGGRFSNDGVEYLLAKHAAVAQQKCLSLRKKRVTPHVLRHTTAMNLVQAGVDRSVLALWLGHESIETTQIYIDVTTEMKEEILKKTTSPKTRASRYRPDDRVLAFLNSL
jgi:site-specific recombinase XerD